MYIMLDIINASAGSMARKAAEAQQAAEGGPFQENEGQLPYISIFSCT